MKVIFTGGGTGGHFYPIIAIAQELNKLASEEHFKALTLYYMSDSPYNERLLFENNITFLKISTGKARRYFSFLNILDVFKTIFGAIHALFRVFIIYPDIIVSKGGYASFPALFSAKLLRIPVMLHESDSVPGKTNKWASKFAKKIAISYKGASEYLPKKKTTFTGNPIRKEIINPIREGSFDSLKLEKGVPVILILGGSQGAQIINETVAQALPELVEKYQIIHQVGKNNFEYIKNLSEVIVGKNEHKNRYKIFPYLDNETMRMSAGVADLVISRAGSTIFEIAVWGLPSIIIPITDSNKDHQRRNAYSYARAGAADVIEEKNLTPHLFAIEVDRLMNDKQRMKEMSDSAKAFSKIDAARSIAEQIMKVLQEHQK